MTCQDAPLAGLVQVIAASFCCAWLVDGEATKPAVAQAIAATKARLGSMIPAYIATRRSIPKFGRPAKRAAPFEASQPRLPNLCAIEFFPDGVSRKNQFAPAISTGLYGWHGSCLRSPVAHSNPRLGTES